MNRKFGGKSTDERYFSTHSQSHKKNEKIKKPSVAEVINFLKTHQEPQKPIRIAKHCGFEASKFINPTLYRMKRLNLIQKIDTQPPKWYLLNNALDMSSPKATSSREPVEQTKNFNKLQKTDDHKTTFLNEFNPHRGSSAMSNRHHSEEGHYQNSYKPGRSSEKIGVDARVRLRNLSFSQVDSYSPEMSVSSEESVMPTVKANVQILFRKTIDDKNAPGAYRVEQRGLDHKKYRGAHGNYKCSSDQTNNLTSEGCAFGKSNNVNKSTEDNVEISEISENSKIDEHNADRETLLHKHLSCQGKQSSEEIPMVIEESTGLCVGKDNSEHTDDEEYDLNFRISDVVSIRDPDILTELSLVNNNTIHTMQSSLSKSMLCDFKQSTAVNQISKQSKVSNATENCEEEIWVGDGYVGSLGHSEIWELENDAEATEEVSRLLTVLHDLPLQSTTKSFLASKMHMAQGDLQKLLDICCKKGWTDYSQLSHIRLTETGAKYAAELKQPIMHQSSGPPPYPDELLFGCSSLKDVQAATRHERLSNYSGHPEMLPTFKFSASKQNSCNQKNILDSSLLSQVNCTLYSSRDRLMPWLSSKTQVVCKEPLLSASSSLTGKLSPLLPTPLTSSLSLMSSSSTFGSSLLKDSKGSTSLTEHPSFNDSSKQIQNTSSVPYIASSLQQEQLPQKRSPLLSTPEMRESRISLKGSFGSGKAALLPFPGQLHYQLLSQPSEILPGLQISTESFAALNKNPISAFMEYGQCRHTPARIEVLSQRGPSHKPVFTIAAVLGSRVFPGITCSNKKDGKKDAAEQAIRILIAEGQYNVSVNSSMMSIPESSMTQFDKIAALTHQKFNQIIAVIPESLVGRKVIAGLVMKMSDDDTGTVIAVGSGNRCITGDKLSLRGLTVNDCHAEIITRRGFIRFLYYQLKRYDSNKHHPLFEKSPTGKLRIKNSISFHLYISTAPCGDGALFSPRDVVSNSTTPTDSCTTHKPTFDSNVQGVLRTKMEGGEGTIPVDPEKPVQTWDGIVRGERLRTMSCSDKICRWNVVGLQGALLAHFLDPVYLNSITLGYLFDAGHLSRAVCCRLNRGEPSIDKCLSFPYHLNHPLLGRVTACDASRETQKTKSYSINWMIEDDRPEIIDGCNGTCYTGEKNEPPHASRLCKRHLLDNFRETCHLLGHKELLEAPTYSVAKMMNVEFLQAKEAMIQKFNSTNCGIWLSKPREEEMFH